MEEEIDLRQYIAILIKHWYWIVGVTLVAALAAFIVSSLLSPTYEAKALVVITRPRLFFGFTSDIRTEQGLLPQYQAFPMIATSDKLLSQLVQALDKEEISLAPNKPVTIEALRSIGNASSLSDPSLVQLTVKLNDPQKAATIANLWADLFVTQANAIHGQSEQEKAMFVAELTQVETELKNIEATLVEIGAKTGQGLFSQESLKETGGQDQTFNLLLNNGGSTYTSFGLLGAELEAQAKLLVASQARRDKLELLISQAKKLQTLVDQNNVNEAAAASSLLAELAQLTSQDNPVDLTLQINLDQNSSLTIKDILATLESNLAATEAAIEKTSQTLTEMQAEMARQRQTFNNLSRQHALKQEVYLALARKVTESEIGDGETDPIRLASYASTPQKPVSPRRLFNTAIVGALALMSGVFVVFALAWWRGAEDVFRVEDKNVAHQPEEQGYQRELGQATSSD